MTKSNEIRKRKRKRNLSLQKSNPYIQSNFNTCISMKVYSIPKKSIAVGMLPYTRAQCQRNRLDKCGSCCIKPMANRVHIFGSTARTCAHAFPLPDTPLHTKVTFRKNMVIRWLRAETHGLSQNISNRYQEAVCRVTSGNGNACAQVPADQPKKRTTASTLV